jgi:asparagine synthase (glutamine-hydrolysing)
MSGIYGVVRFDGKPPQADLAAQQTAMAHWGLNGHSSLTQENAAFGLALLRSTPEAQFEQLPSLACGGNVLLTASARLDNRAELCAALNLDSSLAAVTADGTLLLLAFERWGQDCVQHLLGDWAFAAWDSTKQRLFLARDHFGNTGLHYFLWQHGFAFASGIEGILALEACKPKLDEHFLGRWFLQMPTKGSQTFYQDVFRLPPAHTLVVQNQTTIMQQYWHLENTPALRLRSDQEYVEAFLHTYRQAVHARARADGDVATTLSAGLDSGSVTALAAEVLRGTDKKLIAFTSAPKYATSDLLRRGMPNEWAMAAETANWVKDLEHILIDDAAWTPIRSVRRTLEILQEPNFNAGNMHWILAMMKQVQNRGIKVLLTGQYGNFASSWNGGAYPVWSALKLGQLQTAWRLFGSGSKLRGSATRAFLGELVKPFLQTFQAQWQKSRNQQSLPFWFKNAPVSPILLHQYGLLEEARKTTFFGHQPFLQTTQAQFYNGLQPYASPVGTIWQSFGAAYGIEVRDPTMDKRVLELVASMPITQFIGNGQTRWLMRRAMQGILPPQVQWNVSRGIQGSDTGHRILASAQEVEAVLQGVVQDNKSVSVLNTKMLENTWKKIHLEADNPNQIDGNILLGGLAVGLLLQMLGSK